MNHVTLSGILKGPAVDSGRGVKFTLVTMGRQQQAEEFVVVTFGETAEFMKHNVQSGQRVALAGRITSEKFGTDSFHSVIYAQRILAVGASEDGVDYAWASAGGIGSSEGPETSGGGTVYNRVNVRTVRSWVDRQSGEVNEFTTFVSGTAWEEKAESLPAFRDEAVSFGGFLTPRSYEKNGEDILAFNLSIQELVHGGVKSPAAAPKKPVAANSLIIEEETRYKNVDDDLPF